MITSLDIDAKSYEPNNVFRIDDNTAIITDGKTTFGIYKDHIYKILDGETIPTFNISDIEEMELYNKLATYLREYGTPYHETDIDDSGRTIILQDKVLGYSLGEDKDEIAKDGFEYDDLYNLDCSICELIAPRLKRFKELEPGCPCDMSFEEWQGILDKMIWSFENYRNSDEADENRVNEGLDLFHKYFQNLWY
ncbi:MAG: hypothetical protein II554_06120 [Bacteroidales bacterium]|nr:hypothetical protein [Bacteroidales bacterium]